MLDGMWRVYRSDGTYLGLFETRIGNDVLMLNEETAKAVFVGDILHMDESHTKRAWEVRITGNYGRRSTEFTILKLSDRAERYTDKPITIQVTSHR